MEKRLRVGTNVKCCLKCKNKAKNIKLISLSVNPDDSSLWSGQTVVSGLKQFYPFFFFFNRMFQLGSYILRVTILNSESGNLILQPDLTRCWLNGRQKWWLWDLMPQVRIWENKRFCGNLAVIWEPQIWKFFTIHISNGLLGLKSRSQL